MSSTIEKSVRKPFVRRQPQKLPVPKKLEPLPKGELLQQLVQLERRFRSSFSLDFDGSGIVNVSLSVKPTDPDFPYDIPTSGLPLRLTFPIEYPVKSLIKVEVMLPEVPDNIRMQAESSLLGYVLAERRSMSLVQIMNWFDRNMEKCLTPGALKQQVEVLRDEKTGSQQTVVKTQSGVTIKFGNVASASVRSDDAKSDNMEISSSEHDDSSSELDYEELGEATNELHEDLTNIEEPEERPRGTSIRFHSLNSKNISLAECTLLSILIRCLRCKTHFTARNIVPKVQTTVTCQKCRSKILIYFKPAFLLLQTQNISYSTIGTLEFEGCEGADLLPSNYSLTCASCNLEENETNENAIKNFPVGHHLHYSCFKCHAKLEFELGQVKFFKLGVASLPLKQERTKQKKSKEEQLIVPGQPLPRNGTCDHYKKSFRWFRFPCCGRVFPCDECHNEAFKDEPHEVKFSNKMICGWCSREQLQPKEGDCIHCGKNVKKSAGTGGFWQGGSGTRNQAKMSRNETRKYAGLAKTQSKKHERVGKKSN
jgi:DNA-directed RNA polymerase subunit RPC12/RpoP